MVDATMFPHSPECQEAAAQREELGATISQSYRTRAASLRDAYAVLMHLSPDVDPAVLAELRAHHDYCEEQHQFFRHTAFVMATRDLRMAEKMEAAHAIGRVHVYLANCDFEKERCEWRKQEAASRKREAALQARLDEALTALAARELERNGEEQAAQHQAPAHAPAQAQGRGHHQQQEQQREMEDEKKEEEEEAMNDRGGRADVRQLAENESAPANEDAHAVAQAPAPVRPPPAHPARPARPMDPARPPRPVRPAHPARAAPPARPAPPARRVPPPSPVRCAEGDVPQREEPAEAGTTASGRVRAAAAKRVRRPDPTRPTRASQLLQEANLKKKEAAQKAQDAKRAKEMGITAATRPTSPRRF